MTDTRSASQRKVRRISYEDFRKAATANACCAGDGQDTTTILASSVAKEFKGTRPAETLDELLSGGDGTPVHGVWHHALVGEILFVCLRNAGYPITDEIVEEVLDRGRLIPGGACGFLGTCGALSSAASAYAILLGSTPVATGQREKLLGFSAKLKSRLANVGGSRCCKKSSYAALETAVEEFATLGYELPKEEYEGRCRFFASNETCDGELCVYFPTKA